MPKLTARTVQAIKEPGRYGDGDGLYLEVSRTGGKSWMQRTTVRGRRRDIGLGGVSWVSLAEAREKARGLRKVAKEGGDPIAARQAAKAVPTFEEAARSCYELLKPSWRKGGVHVKHWIRSLERDAFPKIGDLPVDSITSSDVLAVLTPIWHVKPETARRVRRRLRDVMVYARGEGYFEDESPVDVATGSLPKHIAAETQHFPAMPFEKIPAFMAELREREGIAALGLQFLILTAARSGEVRGVTWDEIHLDEKIWTVPGARMKAGKTHRVPLTDDAIEILERARRFGSDLIFPGQKRGKAMSDMTLSAVLRRMGRQDVTVHGFRSSFKTWSMERSTLPREIAELCLAHEVGNVVERAYRRSDLMAKRRQMLESWARWCSSADKSADVVNLRR